jgi:plasmid stabilization system protein ParE
MSRPQLHSRFTPAAKSDLDELIAYLEDAAGVEMADRFIDAVQDLLELLMVTPGLGRRYRFKSGRTLEMRRFVLKAPFEQWIVFYTVTETDILVEQILHGARDLDAFFD